MLLETWDTLELDTSRCSAVQQAGASSGSFSSDGRYLALVGGFGVKLSNATYGAQLCYQDGAGRGRVAWCIDFDDQLLVPEAGCVRVIGVGWGHGPSSCQHLSITGALSLARQKKICLLSLN